MKRPKKYRSSDNRQDVTEILGDERLVAAGHIEIEMCLMHS